MGKNQTSSLRLACIMLVCALSQLPLNGQSSPDDPLQKSEDKKKFFFGGTVVTGVTLGVVNFWGNGDEDDVFFYSINLSPGVIYKIHPNLGVGIALNYGFTLKNEPDASTYGGNLGLYYNPARILQLSLEYEQNYQKREINATNEYSWYPALHAGIGISSKWFVCGLRRNLINNDYEVYGDVDIFFRFYF